MLAKCCEVTRGKGLLVVQWYYGKASKSSVAYYLLALKVLVMTTDALGHF